MYIHTHTCIHTYMHTYIYIYVEREIHIYTYIERERDAFAIHPLRMPLWGWCDASCVIGGWWKTTSFQMFSLEEIVPDPVALNFQRAFGG